MFNIELGDVSQSPMIPVVPSLPTANQNEAADRCQGDTFRPEESTPKTGFANRAGDGVVLSEFDLIGFEQESRVKRHDSEERIKANNEMPANKTGVQDDGTTTATTTRLRAQKQY